MPSAQAQQDVNGDIQVEVETDKLSLQQTPAKQDSLKNFNRFPLLEIDPEMQKKAGIITVKLQENKFQTEILAYAEVLNLKPLLSLRSEFLSAAADYTIAQAELQQAQKNLNRIRNLHKNQAVSTKKLQAQQTLWQSASAENKARFYQMQAIEESSILSWGKRLTEWLLNPETQHFSDLIKLEHTLLQITLPPDEELPEQTQLVYVTTSGMRKDARPAHLFSAAPHTNDVFQGETYYFRTAFKIRTGMHLTVWIPQAKVQTSIFVPATAVIRYMGQQYVYLKTDAEHFERKQLRHLTYKNSGYLTENDLKPGQLLVTVGAQLLLSEEFRGQIPDEDDD